MRRHEFLAMNGKLAWAKICESFKHFGGKKNEVSKKHFLGVLMVPRFSSNCLSSNRLTNETQNVMDITRQILKKKGGQAGGKYVNLSP